MLRKPSGFVLTLVSLAMVASACGGAAYLYVTRLPSPESADLRGLLRWLVTCDLASESTHTQEQLLARLENELRQGVEIPQTCDQLPQPHREQLLRNADLLGRLWFIRQVDRYAAISKPEKPTFLNRQIDELERAGVIKALANLMTDGDVSPKSPWVLLNDRIRSWTASLEPRQKAQADEFVGAVQGNLLLRTLRASFSAKG